MTNCPNCGAPVDLNADTCAFCDTPYTPRAPTKAPPRSDGSWEKITLHMDLDAFAKLHAFDCLTRKEARRLLDLNDIGG